MGKKQLLLNVFENKLSIDKVEIEITENKINEYFEFMEEYPNLFNLGIRPSDGLNIEWNSNGEPIAYLEKSNLHFNNKKEINIESLINFI